MAKKYYWDRLAEALNLESGKDGKGKNGSSQKNIAILASPSETGDKGGAFEYTGQGNPDEPAQMVQSMDGPVMLHKDEMKEQMPDGSVKVHPSPKTLEKNASMPMDGTALEAMAQEKMGGKGMVGLDCGGTYKKKSMERGGMYRPVYRPVKGMADGGTYDPLNPPADTTNRPNIMGTDYTKQAIQQTSDLSRGTDPYMQNVGNKAVQGYNAQTQASQGAERQRMATDTGLTDAGRQAGMAESQRAAESGRANLAGDLAGQSMQRQQQATGQLYDMSMGQKSFEEGKYQFDEGTSQFDQNMALAKEKYGDSQAWKTFEEAALNGDDTTISAAYEAVFGSPPEGDAIINDIRRNARTTLAHEETMMGFAEQAAQLGIDASTLANDASQYNLDAQAYMDIVEMANQGYGYDAIIERFPDAAITETQFDSIYESTTLADRNYGRNMETVQMLLTAGGDGNFAQAATLLEGMNPGVDIDFSRLITAENTNDWNSGMGQMTTYIASGQDSEVGLQSMLADGSLERMGLVNGDGTISDQAYDLYASMDKNVIDEQWNMIETSDWYKGLDEDGKALQKGIFDATQSGELSFALVETFTVTGEDGEVIGTANSQEEANTMSGDNPGSTVSSSTRVAFTDTVTGNVIGTNDDPDVTFNTSTNPGMSLRNGQYVTDNSDPANPVSQGLAAGNVIKVDSGNLTIDDFGYVLKPGEYEIVSGPDGTNWFKDKKTGKYSLAWAANATAAALISNRDKSEYVEIDKPVSFAGENKKGDATLWTPTSMNSGDVFEVEAKEATGDEEAVELPKVEIGNTDGIPNWGEMSAGTYKVMNSRNRVNPDGGEYQQQVVHNTVTGEYYVYSRGEVRDHSIHWIGPIAENDLEKHRGSFARFGVDISDFSTIDTVE